MNSRQRVTVLGLVAIAAVAIGSRRIARQNQRVRLGYELTEARRELRDIEEENRRLRLEYSVLNSPERIKTLAAALGMRRPEPAQIRVVDARGRAMASGNPAQGEP